MPRRGENIYKRKDGRWEGRILKPDGKYRYVYAKTYKEVRSKKKNYNEYVKQDTAKVPISSTDTANLFAHWIESDILSRVKTSTYESYSNCIQKYVIPFFEKIGNECLSEYSVTVFVKFICNNESLSESYKRKLISIFKTALKDILKDQTTGSVIVAAVKLPKTENSEIQAFSMKEQRLIEDAVYQAGDIRSLGILLTFYTGIRLGEICALKWSDFDFETGIMSITKTVTRVKNIHSTESKTMLLIGTPKSKKSNRKIPLPVFLQNLYQEFRPYITNQNCYLLSGTNKPADPRTYQKLYKKLLADIGVNNRKFHAIRHTFATRALELGVDIKTLSEILGHSNVSITLNIYAHSLMEQKKIVMDRFNELYTANRSVVSFVVKDSVINL